jgi:antitoxin component YwqK of YwqJK toxin-antitoxin module
VYYHNGKVQIEETWRDGERHGRCVHHCLTRDATSFDAIYDNDELVSESHETYDEEPIHIAKTHPDGEVKAVERRDYDGCTLGIKEYYVDGTTRFEENYTSGRLYGLRSKCVDENYYG